MHHDALRRLAARALSSGATRACGGNSFFTYEWDISGKCERPVPVEQYAAPEAERGQRFVAVERGNPAPLRVIMQTRCRKCPPCLRARRTLWTARARRECEVAYRTWFGTLTLRPERQFEALTRARQSVARSGQDFDGLSPELQFAARTVEVGRWLTLFLKRVRKQSGASLRYVAVYEPHESGAPHVHLLVHEADTVGTSERMLRLQWKDGFSKWKLVTDRRQASYVTKYLTKTAAVRVRASSHYGAPLGVVRTQDERATKTPSLAGGAGGANAPAFNKEGGSGEVSPEKGTER